MEELKNPVTNRWIMFETISPCLMMAKLGNTHTGILSLEGKENLCVIFGETGKAKNDFWIGYFINIFQNFKIVSFPKNSNLTRKLNPDEEKEFSKFLLSEMDNIYKII